MMTNQKHSRMLNQPFRFLLNLRTSASIAFTSVFAFAILLVITGGAVWAQESENAVQPSRIGLFGNYDYSLFSGSFSQLPGIANCCPEFTSGGGGGWLAGLSYVTGISKELNFQVRLHYGSYGGTFTTSESKMIVDGSDNSVMAEISHELTGYFNQISFEPLLGYRVSRDFTVLGGITAGYVLSSTFDQREVLVSPSGAVFSGVGSKQRNVLEGADIPNASSLALGLTVGGTYDIALNKSRTVFLSPEILFTLSPFSVAKDVSWTIQHLRGGLHFSFIPPAIEDSLTDDELYQFVKAMTPPTRATPGIPFVADITASGLTSEGQPTPASAIRVEEFESNRVRPLLPYVFFDYGSSELPYKYSRLSSDQKESYDMRNFYNLDAMVTYYQLLNVVGKRMEENPSATITLTGCVDKTEIGNVSIPMNRANAVKKYLTSTWDVDDSRINVVSRELPAEASNGGDADGQAENRRVEISSSDPSILAAVASKDTLRDIQPAGLRFTPSIDPRVPVHSWTVWVTASDRIVKTFHDGDPIPAELDWRIAEQGGAQIGTSRQLKYLVGVRDSVGQLIPSETKTININHITLADKKQSGQADKTKDRYSMILFPFDKSDLTSANADVVQQIKSSIQPTSTVKVIGYTDRSGSADYNQKLSEQRARSVSKALSLPDSVASGVGERLPLYDNNTPEGRFYSRTVEVIVETSR